MVTFLLLLLLLGLIVSSACTAAPNPTVTPGPTLVEDATPTALPTNSLSILCELPPVTAPTKPAVIPDYTELDESTGLHITGKAPEINLEDFRLKVNGKVNHRLSLTYDELRCMPKITAEPALICVGVFEDVAQWSGVPLRYVLGLAGVQSDAKAVRLLGGDGYQVKMLMEEALGEEIFLAYEWEGQPLPVLHGFPLRVVAPNLYGSNWVKWLIEINVE